MAGVGDVPACGCAGDDGRIRDAGRNDGEDVYLRAEKNRKLRAALERPASRLGPVVAQEYALKHKAKGLSRR